MGTRGGTDVGALVPKWPSCLFSSGFTAFKAVPNPGSSGKLDVEAQASQPTFQGVHLYFWGELAVTAEKVKQLEENNLYVG